MKIREIEFLGPNRLKKKLSCESVLGVPLLYSTICALLQQGTTCAVWAVVSKASRTGRYCTAVSRTAV
eukprot:COSAG01_NODE_9066_length_2565_cov_1.377534_1_plen_67_part_10